MGLFGNGKEIKRLQAQVMQLQRHNNIIQLSGLPVFPSFNINQIADRYCNTDDVYSVIRLLVTKAIGVPIYPFIEKDKQAAKKLKRLPFTTKNYQRKAYEKKALEYLPENDPVYELLENPSDLLSKFEYYEAIYSMLFLHGEAIIYKERGSILGKPRKLHILYPQHVVMKITKEWPQTVAGYQFIVDGQVIMAHIPPEDIIHIKYFNPNFSITGNELRGLSPLRVLANRLSRMDAEMNASVAQLQNGGIPGIVYDKGVDPLNGPDVIGQRRDNFHRYLSNMGNKGAPYFSGGELGYIPLGLKLADMDVAALDKIDFKKLCNVYNISDRLFNNDATGSEISDDNARKGAYVDAVLPNVRRVASAIEMSLNKDFPDKVRILNPDISEIKEMQDDMNEMATWLANSPQITWNERREMQGFDRIENPIFDEPLIPTGLMTPADLIAVDELPNPAKDYE